MIYGFNARNRNEALASLIVYQIYRSRDVKKFPISTKMWTQIADFTKLAAAKSESLARFVELFKEPLRCGEVKPFATKLADILQLPDGKNFLSSFITSADDADVLYELEKSTSFVIMLVRERLEIDKEPEEAEEMQDNLLGLKQLAETYGDKQ